MRVITMDQAILLTQNMRTVLKRKRMAGAMLVDLTVAYDTVWHCNITCKLLSFFSNKHIV